MKQNHDLNPVEVFLKSWRVYQEVIQSNYMFHREISEAARLAVQDFESSHKLRVLDLGCGDASMAIPLLSTDQIESYIGCDLSQPALDIARGQLTAINIPHRLCCEDMLQFLTEQATASADLVLSSYSIHHLSADDKQHLVRQVARVLVPRGRFIVIDIFREPGETRIDYMSNYMDALRRTWSGLSDEAQGVIIDHATQYDYPELPMFYVIQCQKNGFDVGHRLKKHTWHEAWVFTKIFSERVDH